MYILLPSHVFNLTFYHHSVYWMAGLAHDAAHFFKFLFILVLYTLAMTLWVCLFVYLFSLLRISLMFVNLEFLPGLFLQ